MKRYDTDTLCLQIPLVCEVIPEQQQDALMVKLHLEPYVPHCLCFLPAVLT